MKKYLLYGLAGTMLFATSATVSLWTQQQIRPKAEAETGRPAKSGKESTSKTKEEAAKAEQADELRQVVRPSGPPSAEDTARIAQTLRERLKSVRQREEQIESRQKQLELIYQDIRGERNVLDELRKQVGDEMKALNDRLVAVDRKAGDLEQQRQTMTKSQADLKKNQIEVDGSERKNIDRMATMYDSMAPDAAARILQQMADSGRLDTAVKLLAQMKERQAAKVLAELPDATLAAQLLEKMKGIKRQGTPTSAATTSAASVIGGQAPSGELPR